MMRLGHGLVKAIFCARAEQRLGTRGSKIGYPRIENGLCTKHRLVMRKVHLHLLITALHAILFSVNGSNGCAYA